MCKRMHLGKKELGMSGMMDMSVIPVLGRLAQETWEFEDS